MECSIKYSLLKNYNMILLQKFLFILNRSIYETEQKFFFMNNFSQSTLNGKKILF